MSNDRLAKTVKEERPTGRRLSRSSDGRNARPREPKLKETSKVSVIIRKLNALSSIMAISTRGILDSHEIHENGLYSIHEGFVDVAGNKIHAPLFIIENPWTKLPRSL